MFKIEIERLDVLKELKKELEELNDISVEVYGVDYNTYDFNKNGSLVAIATEETLNKYIRVALRSPEWGFEWTKKFNHYVLGCIVIHNDFTVIPILRWDDLSDNMKEKINNSLID